MSEYPEHDKLMRFRKEADAIGGFLEILESKGIVLATRDDFGDLRRLSAGRWAAFIGEYFEIDTERLESEKRAMLDKLRGDSRPALAELTFERCSRCGREIVPGDAVAGVEGLVCIPCMRGGSRVAPPAGT